MQTNLLKRTHPNRKRMQVARGGKRGKTSGRGGKGQTARAGNKRRPEWRDIIKKLPKLRGRGKNSNRTVVTNVQKPTVINLRNLEGVFKAGDVVNPITLIEKRVISTWSGKVPRVKILGEGELTIAIKVSGVDISKSAKAAIEKAGGTVTIFVPIVTATKVAKVADISKATEKSTKAAVPVAKSMKAAKAVKVTKIVKAVKVEKTPKAKK